jgi:serine/threonine protein kinase
MTAMPPCQQATADPILLDMVGERETVAPGRLLDGRWLVLRLLSQGSQCQVYELLDTAAIATNGPDPRGLPRSALKRLRPALIDHAPSRAFLAREQDILCHLGAINGIAALQGTLDLVDGPTALRLSLAPGKPLGRWLAPQGPGERLPPSWVGPLLLSLAATLQALHARGVVHGDIKPGNVLVASGGQTTLVDFGSARLLGGGAAHNDPATDSLGGQVAVTPAWASPRLGAGHPVEPGDDLYALTLLAARLISGRHPFGGQPPTEARKAGRRAEPIRRWSLGRPWGEMVNHILNGSAKDDLSLTEWSATFSQAWRQS